MCRQKHARSGRLCGWSFCEIRNMKHHHKRNTALIAVVWVSLLFAPLFTPDIFDIPLIRSAHKFLSFLSLVLFTALPATIVAYFFGATSWCIGRTSLGRLGFRLFATPYDAEEFNKMKDHPHFKAIFSAGMFLGVWITMSWVNLKLFFPGIARGLMNWLTHNSIEY